MGVIFKSESEEEKDRQGVELLFVLAENIKMQRFTKAISPPFP